MGVPTKADLVSRDAPLRLADAVRIAFPMGGLTVSALRRAIADRRLTAEKLAGKYFVTIAAIEEMRSSCRVPAKVPDFGSKEPKTGSQHGSSETGNEPSALDAMNAIATAQLESLRPTSSKGTTRKKASAKVIQIPSK